MDEGGGALPLYEPPPPPPPPPLVCQERTGRSPSRQRLSLLGDALCLQGHAHTHKRQPSRGSFLSHRQTVMCALNSPRPALPVSSLSRATAIADVIAIDGDELLAAFGRLLLLSELVVLPAPLVLPQLPVPPLRSEGTVRERLSVCSAETCHGSCCLHDRT